MALSKFALACIAALAAGTGAGLAGGASPAPQQDSQSKNHLTAISTVARPAASFRGVVVRSGGQSGLVRAVATDAQGRAMRIEVRLADGSSRWLGKDELTYSRAHNTLYARDLGPTPVKVALR